MLSEKISKILLDNEEKCLDNVEEREQIAQQLVVLFLDEVITIINCHQKCNLLGKNSPFQRGTILYWQGISSFAM